MLMVAPTPAQSDASAELEYSILGGLINDPRRIDAVADILAPEDFADRFYADIYGTLISEHAQGRTVNTVTLRPLLERHPAYQEAGGTAFLAKLTASLSLMVPPVPTAKMIADMAKRRRVVAGLTEAMEAANDPATGLDAIVETADAALSEVSLGARGGIAQPTAGDAVEAAMRAWDQPRHGIISERIPSLDNVLGPLLPKQLVIGAGRPGMGKTAVALSYAIGAAKRGHGVLFVSLEMASEELGQRMLSDLCFDEARTGVPFEAIVTGHMETHHRRRCMAAADEARELPLQIIDTGKLTMGRLSMLVRRHKRRFEARGHKLDLVIIDYLQLLTPDGGRKSRYEEVTDISIGLKQIAKDQSVAMFALAQLSREVEKRQDKRPQLSDLRDSGQIEQDADKVLFLYRHEYYLRQEERAQEGHKEHDEWRAALERCQNRIEFICAKRRNGTTRTLCGEFWAGNQAVRG